MRGRWAAWLGCVSLVACADQVLGPVPKLASVSPLAACPSQNVTPITLTGTNLTPVVANALSSSPELNLPRITLVQVLTLTGASLTRSLVLPDDAAGDHVRWTDTKSLVFDVYPELGLQPGLYGIEITDPDGLPGILTSGLVLVPPPLPQVVTPDLLGSTHDTTLLIAGAFLIGNGTNNPSLQVAGAGLSAPLSFPAASLQACTALLGGSGLSACLAMTAVVPAGSVPPGPYQITVQNPDPVGCASLTPLSVGVAAVPTINQIQAELDCTAESSQPLEILGSGFIQVLPADGGPAVNPVVEIGPLQLSTTPGDCVALPGPVDEGVQTCDQLAVTLPQGSLSPGSYTVQVTNPTGDVVEVDGGYTEVPPPAVTDVQADLSCDAQGDQTVTVNGSGFLVLDGGAPEVVLNPSVGGGGSPVTLTELSASGCVAVQGVTGEPALTCTSLSGTLPAGAASPGTYSVVVINGDAAACQSQQPVGFVVVAPPGVSSIAPDLACGAGPNGTVSVSGSGFLVVAGQSPQVVVSGGSGPLSVSSTASQCVPISGLANESASECQELEVSLPSGALTAGDYQLSVTNPIPAGCASTTSVDLTITGPPALTQVTPDLACAAQASRTLTLAGTGFLQMGSQVPSVSLQASGGSRESATGVSLSNCTPLTGPGETSAVCTQLTASVGPSIPAGAYSATVTNPGTDGCASSVTVPVTLLAAPQVSASTPDVVCTAGGPQAITLKGAGWVTVGSSNPTATVGSTALATAASACTPIANLTEETAQTCTALSLTLPQGLDAGLLSISVANPNPAGCDTAKPLALLDLPAPSVTSATPVTACNASGGTSISVSGSNFVTVGSGSALSAPTVTLTGTGAVQTLSTTASRCTSVAGASETLQSCAQLTANASSPLAAGAYQLTVTNPSPASCSSGSIAVALIPAAAPTLLSPDVATAGAAPTLTVTGDFFIDLAGTPPTVQITGGGLANPLQLSSAVSTCRTFPGETGEQACQVLTFALPSSGLGAGKYQVQIQNPGPVACATSSSLALTVVPEPTLGKVQADLICTAQSTSSVTLTGSGFLSVTGLPDGGSLAPVVSIGSSTFAASASGCSPVSGPVDEDLQSCSTLTVSLPEGSPSAGSYAVSVANPFGGVTPSRSLTVVAPPGLSSITPALTCAGPGTLSMGLSGSGFVTVGNSAPTVELIPPLGDGGLTVAGSATGCTAIPGLANESAATCTGLSATVNTSGLANGVWTVQVTNPTPAGCTSLPPLAFTVAPPPSPTSIAPDLACDAQGATSLTVQGSGFLEVGAATPTLSLSGGSANGLVLATTTAGCTPLGLPGISAQSCTSLTASLSENALAAGNYQVVITNPAPAGCASSGALDLTIEGAPALKSLSPDLACASGNTVAISLGGTNFLEVAGAPPALALAPTGGGNATTLVPVTAGGCSPLSGPTESVESCTSLGATVPAGQPAGSYRVEATNPGAGCQGLLPTDLVLVSPPSASSLTPDIACTGLSATVQVVGSGFVTSGAAAPSLNLGGQSIAATTSQCTAISGLADETASTCTSLSATVPAGLDAGAYPVRVSDPAALGCASAPTLSLLELPPPQITSMSPDLACVAQGATSFTLTGSGFATIVSAAGTAGPQVRLSSDGGSQLLSSTASACTGVSGATESVSSCTSLTVSLPSSVAVGRYLLSVMNPAPAACASASLPMDVIAPPSVSGVGTSGVACLGAGVSTLSVAGSGFLFEGAASPTVVLTPPQGTATTLTASAAGSCSAVSGLSESAQVCSQVTASLPASLAPGAYQVSVTNPGGGTCTSAATQLEILPTPAVSSAGPSPVCLAAAGTPFSVTGSGFAVVDGGLPTLTLVGSTSQQETVVASSASGCTALPAFTGGAQVSLCTGLSATLSSAAASALGSSATVAVEDPGSDCPSSASTCLGSGCLSWVAPPVIASASPTAFCTSGGTLTLQGTNLQAGELTITSAGGTESETPVVVAAGNTQATAQLPVLAAGTYTLSYTVGSGSCSADTAGGQAWTQSVTVGTGPELLVAETPVVYGAISTPITLLVSGLSPPIASLKLQQGSDGGSVDLTSTAQVEANGQVSAVIPAGTPAGLWSVTLQDATQCPAILAGAEEVVGVATPALASVDPTTGFQSGTTELHIEGVAHGTFAATPEAWLSPVVGGSAAVALVDLSVDEPASSAQPDTLVATLLPTSASTPLPTGSYDLVVANLNGSVDILPSGFAVSAQASPTISSVVPDSFPGGSNQGLVIAGTGFAVGGAVQLACAVAGSLPDAGATLVTGTNVSVSGGGTQLSATVNVASGQVCSVAVTNSDGSIAAYQSVAAYGSSSPFSAFATGPSMTGSRGQLGAVIGKPTSDTRFAYALGGNEGAGPVSSAESAPLGVFGSLGSFNAEPNALAGAGASGFTFAPDGGLIEQIAVQSWARGTAVSVGRFVYLVGGSSDGSTPLSGISRAEILDPADAPQLIGVAPLLDTTGQGFTGPGSQTWRVSAVFDSSYANNPGGESLPSSASGLELCDPGHSGAPMDCPAVSGLGLDVQLSWKPVAHAASYRVYRTPSFNQGPESAVLLATVPAGGDPVTFVDRGTSPTSTEGPLVLGNLGQWATVASLATGRIAPAVAAAVDPGNASAVYLYALGGLSAGGALRSDYEIIPIALGADSLGLPIQTPGASVAGSSSLVQPQGSGTAPLGEWLSQAWATTGVDAPAVPSGQVYVIVGPGATNAAGTATGQAIDFGVLSAGAGGQLSTLAVFGGQLPASGYGMGVHAGSLAVFNVGGGLTPSISFEEGVLANPPNGLAGPFASDGLAMNVARVELATASSGGTILVLGGWTAGPPGSSPTATTELSSW